MTYGSSISPLHQNGEPRRAVGSRARWVQMDLLRLRCLAWVVAPREALGKMAISSSDAGHDILGTLFRTGQIPIMF